MNAIPEITAEVAGLVHLVAPQTINAKKVKKCLEIELSRSTIPHPDYNDGRGINPSQLLKELVGRQWTILTIAYKRNDGATNFGHDPAVNHVLVAVLVYIP